MYKKIFLLPFFLLLLLGRAEGQGQLSGDFVVQANVYDYDSAIGTNTTQYDHELFSAESWMFLNYRISGFTVSARFDLYNNSPLWNPQEAYTKQGIGFYSASKKFNKWNFTVGHFYDQIGSGAIFRAFEDRTIGLDYAVQGARVEFSPNDSFMVKAFTGLQKNRFDVRPQVIKGVNTEKTWGIGGLTFRTGLGMTNRTLDQNTMVLLADIINSWPLEQRFVPKYNVFAGTAYNTFSLKNISLYTEYAYKTPEAVFITAPDGSQQLINSDGEVLYGSLGYSLPGFGVNLQYKKIDNFILRTDPFTILLNGVMNYLPPLSKQHSFRLPARYSISALAQGEEGYQAEVTFSPNQSNTFNGSFSYIQDPAHSVLFREYYLDYKRRFNRYFKGEFGIQSVRYDQEIYEFKPQVKPVQTITPFVELDYRFKKNLYMKPLFSNKTDKVTLRPSLRTELQYLRTEQDLGDFAFALLELNFAPSYSIAVSDMVNTKPKAGTKQLHYYSIFTSYTKQQTRFYAGYSKQVQGVVCTGGVCRVEPAFSGFRFGVSTNF